MTKTLPQDVTPRKRGRPTIEKEAWEKILPLLKAKIGRGKGKAFTAAGLAQQIGLTGPAISQWINDTNRPDMANAARLLRAIGEDPANFFADLSLATGAATSPAVKPGHAPGITKEMTDRVAVRLSKRPGWVLPRGLMAVHMVKGLTDPSDEALYNAAIVADLDAQAGGEAFPRTTTTDFAPEAPKRKGKR